MPDMPYTTYAHAPKVRAKAVEKVRREGWSIRKVARHYGVEPSTVSRWCAKAAKNAGRVFEIPTVSSRPKRSPRAIDPAIVSRIVETRQRTGRCAEVVHAHLAREGIEVSLSTVKRYLDKYGLRKKKSPWKKWHQSGERPIPERPGKLVQMDTIHIMQSKIDRMYIFTVVDVHSRWAYAKASQKISAHLALLAFRKAQEHSPFHIDCVQSDHGPEFAQHFTTYVQAAGIRHRHIRVRQPNDNAHVERFNRTIQEELRTEIQKYKNNIPWLNRSINEYIQYYNNERLHLGIDLKTPNEMI